MASAQQHADWAMDDLKIGGDAKHARVHAELAKAMAFDRLAAVLEELLTQLMQLMEEV